MEKVIMSDDMIQKCIFWVRGQKVMLSPHLAKLYGLEVRSLVQAVKRNRMRFPDDFMFQLSQKEADDLKSQIVISSWGGSRRAMPYAFTEQGVAMLSSILRGDRAVVVNIHIMRTFVRLRQMVMNHKEFALRLAELEHRVGRHDGSIQVIFEALKKMMRQPDEPRRRIGFHSD